MSKFIKLNKENHPGFEKPEFNYDNLQPTNEVKIMLNQEGVKETVEMMELFAAGFDAVYEANADGKIDFPEDYISIGMKVSMKVIPAFNGATKIVDELIFDEVTEQEQAELARVFDECKNLKGDTRDATRDLLSIVNHITNWRLKYFGKPQINAPE